MKITLELNDSKIMVDCLDSSPGNYIIQLEKASLHVPVGELSMEIFSSYIKHFIMGILSQHIIINLKNKMYISSYFTMEIIPNENIKNLKYIIKFKMHISCRNCFCFILKRPYKTNKKHKIYNILFRVNWCLAHCD